MVVTEQLPEKLRDRNAGKTLVKDVKVDFREDSSEQEALFVVLVLSDPPAGNESWPIDDLWALRRITQETIADLTKRFDPDWEMPWFVSFEPENPELLSEDDELPLADD
jgi:hypothetical protein